MVYKTFSSPNDKSSCFEEGACSHLKSVVNFNCTLSVVSRILHNPAWSWCPMSCCFNQQCKSYLSRLQLDWALMENRIFFICTLQVVCRSSLMFHKWSFVALVLMTGWRMLTVGSISMHHYARMARAGVEGSDVESVERDGSRSARCPTLGGARRRVTSGVVYYPG